MAFCPKCRSEYRAGFMTCADCNVALVAQLPEVRKADVTGSSREIDVSSLKFISVFVSDEPQETETVRCVLTDNHIPFITRGEDERRVRYVDFLVREDKAQEARELFKDLINNDSGIESAAPLTQEIQDDRPPAAQPGLPPRGVAPRHESFNFVILFLMASLVLLFGLKVQGSVKYFLAGGVMIVLIMTIVFSRDKRI